MSKPSLFDDLIDQYKLEKHLAQSSLTDLYLAYDVDENRQVAVEILLPRLSQNRAFTEQFVAKMRTVSQLKHPNIAQVLQVGNTPFNNRPYVAREHVEAYPLRDRLEQLAQQSTAVNSVYALKLVRQIAEALALAERLEIYHYDLQPDKIMLQTDGNIILTDLGIPHIKETTLNGNGVNQDSRYWSPEQIQGKPMDGRSHVYSMGILLYQLLTGKLPEQEGSFWENVKKSPLPVGKSNLELERDDLSMETVRLVNRALRIQTWGRFANSNEFRAAIDEAIKAEEFQIRTGAKPAHRDTRQFLLMVAASAVALVAIFGIGFLVFRAIQANDSSLAQATNTIPAVVMEPTPTPTEEPPTAVSITIINPFEPANGQQVGAGETVPFGWNWPETLTGGQQFQVLAFAGESQYMLGSVNAPADGETYRLQVSATDFPAGAGEYAWQVILVGPEAEAPLAQSEQRTLIITAPPTATNTAVPTDTPTVDASATSTPTPTPLPQVRVIVSSASLREGPSTRYNIITFLEAGDVVTILAIDEQDGDWYNVEMTDGSERRGWLAISVSERVDSGTQTIPRAATIPPSPTPTHTPTPTPTPTPTLTPSPQPPSGGGSQPPGPPPTLTPPPSP